MSQFGNIHPRILDRMCSVFSQSSVERGAGAALLHARDMWGTTIMKYLNNKDIKRKKELVQNER